MANPQLDQGHTRVANAILDNIMKVSLNGTQFRIVMAVWRFTYGFQRKEHQMSASFIAVAINASKSQVVRELSVLIERDIIVDSDKGPSKTRVISFNKNFEKWKDCPAARGQSPVEIKKPKKKRTAKAAVKTPYKEGNSYLNMAHYFHKKVAAVANAEGLNHQIIKADMQKWADDMRKLVELDKVDKHLAKSVMDWVTTDSFWRVNILSAKKLRAQFGTLALRMKGSQNIKPNNQPKDSRDKDIEFQRWVAEGNDPDDFNWN